MNDWHEVDDWKQITSNLVVAEGQVHSFDILLERLRLRIASRLWCVVLLGLALFLSGVLLFAASLYSLAWPGLELVPGVALLMLFALYALFAQMQKLREMLAEAESGRASQEHARRRVLDRDLGGIRA